MNKPLAYRMRPKSIDDIIGQPHLVGNEGIIRKLINNEYMSSMILFGPPGGGKTSLAHAIALSLDKSVRFLNAANCNKKDIDLVIAETSFETPIILIMDEIHRLNKDKQDLLLPHTENGDIILIGLTTANPLHSINPALRSRCHLFEVMSLTQDDVRLALVNALKQPHGLDSKFDVDAEALDYISKLSGGDIRFALNALELCCMICTNNKISLEDASSSIKNSMIKYDKSETHHYTLLSAFQKSIRGSDVQAALYYLAKLIEIGDLESLERRLIVIAYEDVGLGNPAACARVLQAIDGAKRVGFPEASIILANVVIDLALSPKSKSASNAIHLALDFVKTSDYQIPNYLNLSPIGLQEEEQYDYSRSDLWPLIQYLPNEIRNAKFYSPVLSGQYEKALKVSYDYLSKFKRTNNLASLKLAKKNLTKN